MNARKIDHVQIIVILCVIKRGGVTVCVHKFNLVSTIMCALHVPM